MKRIHKRTVLLSILAVFLAALLLIVCLFWPIIRSAIGVKKLEDGLYSMEYSGDYGLEDFLEQGGKSSDMAVLMIEARYYHRENYERAYSFQVGR